MLKAYQKKGILIFKYKKYLPQYHFDITRPKRQEKARDKAITRTRLMYDTDVGIIREFFLQL